MTDRERWEAKVSQCMGANARARQRARRQRRQERAERVWKLIGALLMLLVLDGVIAEMAVHWNDTPLMEAKRSADAREAPRAQRRPDDF